MDIVSVLPFVLHWALGNVHVLILLGILLGILSGILLGILLKILLEILLETLLVAQMGTLQ